MARVIMDTLAAGQLAPIPRFDILLQTIGKSHAQICYSQVYEAMSDLGRAMQLGQHRRLIDSLNSKLNAESLVAVTSASCSNAEVCAAFSVYFTTLEQAYHWPRDDTRSTLEMLENHKLAIQVLNQPPLHQKLQGILQPEFYGQQEDDIPPANIAQTALSMARAILAEAQLCHQKEVALARASQDIVNLLYRTCRSDWFDQGDYRDPHSHKQFGRLHEVIRASGTQRRMQELFEESSGLLCLQKMPNLLRALPSTSEAVDDALGTLQVAIAIARDELYSFAVDEVIWGRAFANFTKAVGFCDISAGGGNTPIWRMLDALCGQANSTSQSKLLEEINIRSRIFPPNIRLLVNDIAAAPSLRAHLKSPHATYKLQQSFQGLEQLRFSLYEMHRKKAARIGLALRAGQLGTSSIFRTKHTTNLPPENHVADALKAAMKTRFGDDAEALRINAMACSHSLIMDDDEQIHASQVRFYFSTPLAVGPGDCLAVTVQLPDGTRLTRTYCITYTYSCKEPLATIGYQLVHSVDVHVRRKGLVSSYLCNQNNIQSVHVAIKPASYFRIDPNLAKDEVTVFIGQGGAIGIFVAWLTRQKQLHGRYVLIVGVRQYRTLAYKGELYDLAATKGQQVQICVALSMPDTADMSVLQSGGVEAYHERVDGYLDQCSFENMKAVFVCGSPSFALNVTRSKAFCDLRQSDGRYEPRLSPIITSRMPVVRMQVSSEHQNSVIQSSRLITRSELSLHNMPKDLWIAVGNNVYDITDFSKFHPGGENILMYRAGRQAEDLFLSVHNDCVGVKSLLECMLIGQLEPPKQKFHLWEKRLDQLIGIQNDLSNHSRFEKLPSDLDNELCEVPPSEVIYASVQCLCKTWPMFLEECSIHKSYQENVQLAGASVRDTLDTFQASVYETSFNDVKQCRRALSYIFETHRAAAHKIDAALDSVKNYITTHIADDKSPSIFALVTCTDQIIQALDGLAQDLKGM